MLLQSKFLKVISILTLVLGLSVFALADVIRLKDGSVIKGKITSFENGQFTIVIGEGARQRQMKFYADEIDQVIFENEAQPAVIRTNSTTTPPPRRTTSNPPTSKPNYDETRDGDSTIITVGSAPRTNNPPTTSPKPRVENTESNNTTPVVRTSVAKPIQLQSKVLADNTSNGWTNAGWVVRKGQRIRIKGNGRVSLGNGRYSGPRGISTLPDESKLMKDKPTGGLIAVIGDDNNDFIFIGEELEFVAQRDGALFLGVNEGYLNDNTGAFDVTIEISTAIGN